MRIRFAAAVLLAAFLSALPAPAETSHPFDAKEPISLDLKDAKITEVVTLLGALANVPVYIDPDVEGTVTIQLVDVPFEKVIQQVTRETGVLIRFENGKLVASRSKTSLMPAVTLPENLPDGPRVAVEDYPRGFAKLPPLYLRGRTGDGASCNRLVFESGEPPRFELSGVDGPVAVTQFGWEPVTRSRFMAIESASAFSAQRLSDSELGSFTTNGWTWSSRAPDGESCSAPVRTAGHGSPVILQLEIREGSSDGMRVIATPKLSVRAGQVFSMRGGIKGDTGQHREYIVHGFLTADGKSVAAAIVATAIWVDPKDGKEYVYAQTGPGRGVKSAELTGESILLASLPAGTALSKPLDLSIAILQKKEAAD